MNIVDYVIIGVVVISVIYGIYRGFVASILSVACFLLSLFLAFTFGPRLSTALRGNEGIRNLITTYTDGVAPVKDNAIAGQNVETLDDSLIGRIMDSVKLPDEIKQIVYTCLNDKVFAGTGVSTVKDYMEGTLAGVIINVLSYIVCFFVCILLCGIIGSVIRHIFDLPVLKQLDGLAGAVLGLARGVLIVYVLFLLIPIISTLSPVEGLEQLVDESKMGHFFRSGAFFTRAAGLIN